MAADDPRHGAALRPAGHPTDEVGPTPSVHATGEAGPTPTAHSTGEAGPALSAHRTSETGPTPTTHPTGDASPTSAAHPTTHSGPDSSAIWLRPLESPLGRPARHTRVDITLAAVAVGDRGGLDAVTMRSVAAELGTAAGSLYRHVRSRAELVDLMVDHVAAEYAFTPPTGEWTEDLAAVVRQGLAIHRRHPWLVKVTGTPLLGPNGLRFVEHFLAVLDDHPATDGQKLTAMAVLNALVTSFARHQHPDAERAAAQGAYLAQAVTAESHPHLAALAAPSEQATEADLPKVITAALRGLLETE